MYELKPENIDYAIQKFRNFVRVQKENPRDIRVEAVDRFAEGVGIDALLWEHLTEGLDNLVDGDTNGELGWAIIGVLLGLYMVEGTL